MSRTTPPRTAPTRRTCVAAVTLTVVALTGVASCSSGGDEPERTPAASRPPTTEAPETPEPTVDRDYVATDVDPSLLEPGAFGLGRAVVTDAAGYAVDVTWSGSVGEVTVDPTTNKPGETTVTIPVRVAVTVHNVTPDRETPLVGGLATAQLAPAWPADSPVCQAIAATGPGCTVGSVPFPLAEPLPVDAWRAGWVEEVLTLVVPESAGEAVAEAARAPGSWLVHSPGDFATWALDDGHQAVSAQDAPGVRDVWWVSSAAAGIPAPLVGGTDPASVDLDTTRAGAALTALLAADHEETFACPVLPAGATTTAPLASIWGFDSSLQFSDVFVWGVEPPELECATADGAPGGLTVRLSAPGPDTRDAQGIANATDAQVKASQSFDVYGGSMVLVEYDGDNVWAYWSDENVAIGARIAMDPGPTGEKLVRVGQWMVAALPTMLTALGAQAG